MATSQGTRIVAGDWIKMRKNLPDDPAVIGIATRLSMDPDAVLGKLYRFWSWVETHTTTGRCAHVTQVWLDSFLRAEKFTNALEFVGWISIDENGITVPKFSRHMSQGAKRRALAANRQALHRSRSRHAAKATKASPEKRREEKSKDTPNGVSSPLPPSLETDGFRAAWADWLGYRRERRLTCTARTLAAQLRSAAEWGPDVAAEAIALAIRSGWQGLFDPREKQRNGRPGEPGYRPEVDTRGMDLSPKRRSAPTGLLNPKGTDDEPT